MFKIKEKQDVVYVDDEFGYRIEEGHLLTQKEYKEIKPWEGVPEEDDKGDEDEIDPFTGIPVECIPSMFATRKFEVIFDDDKIEDVIIFNAKDLATFREKVPGTTFLFVPFTETYNRNTCTKGEFLENDIVKKYKTPEELTYERILDTLQNIKEQVLNKKVTVELVKPCSVEGYETDIKKTGVLVSFEILDHYGTINLNLSFENGDTVETSIYNDVLFSKEKNSYTMEWAGMTATDYLEITILD